MHNKTLEQKKPENSKTSGKFPPPEKTAMVLPEFIPLGASSHTRIGHAAGTGAGAAIVTGASIVTNAGIVPPDGIVASVGIVTGASAPP